jgi:hypothetical protein
MPYQMPTLKELQDHVATLRTVYLATGKKDPARLKTIGELEEFSKKLTDPKDNFVLHGRLTHELVTIHISYDNAKWSRDPTSSDLFNALMYKPYTSKENPVSPQMQLVAMKAYIEYEERVKKQEAKKENKTTTDAKDDKDVLTPDKVPAKFKPTVEWLYKRVEPEISQMAEMGMFITLKDQLSRLEAEYLEAKAKEPKTFMQGPATYLANCWPFSNEKNRKRSLAIVRLLKPPFIDSLLPKKCKTEMSKERYRQSIIRGYLVCLMSAIPTECWGSATNSKLYQLAIKILGVENISQLKPAAKEIYITNFRAFLRNVENNQAAMDELGKSNYFSTTTSPKRFVGKLLDRINRDFKPFIRSEMIIAPVMLGLAYASNLVTGWYVSKAARAAWDTGFAKGVIPGAMGYIGKKFKYGNFTAEEILAWTGTLCEDDLGPKAIRAGGMYGFSLGTGRALPEERKDDARTIIQQTYDFTADFDTSIERTKLVTDAHAKPEWVEELDPEMFWIDAAFSLHPDPLKRMQTIRDAEKNWRNEVVSTQHAVQAKPAEAAGKTAINLDDTVPAVVDTQDATAKYHRRAIRS